MEDLRGKTFNGYRIIEPLGEGGMAAVYRAYQASVDRYVALKVLPQHFAKDKTFVERFKREAHVLARLQHPHIVPVYDYGEAEGYTYIVMPLLEAGTLSDKLEAGQPMPLPEVRRLMIQVADALDYAQAQGIIHRDVKPSNVLLDERGNALLTDFGIAKMLEGQHTITVTGGIVGTPAYMSPEQGMGEELDGRSDIYALGVILYELCTGRVPFQAETPMAVMFKHISDPLPPPNELNPDLPQSMERVILKAMAKERADRYTTPADMVQALQQEGYDGQPESAPAQGGASTAISAPDTKLSPATDNQSAEQTLPSPQPSPKKFSWSMAIGGVVLLLLIGIPALVFFSSRGQQTPTPESTLAAVVTAEATADEPAATPTEPQPAPTVPVQAVVTPTLTTTASLVLASPNPTAPDMVTETVAISSPTPAPPATETLPAPTLPPEPTATPALPTETPTPEPTPTAKTDFPLPNDLASYTNTFAGESFSFTTPLSLEELALFYQVTFEEMGMQEIEMMRVLEQGNLNLVYANWPADGRRVQVSGSDLALTTPDNLRVIVLSFQDAIGDNVVFPLSDDAQVMTAGVDGEEVLYQSGLSIDGIINFYRATFADLDMQELTPYTTITDGVASLVFDGWPDESRQVVLQIVDLGQSTQSDLRTVSLRFEATQ